MHRPPSPIMPTFTKEKTSNAGRSLKVFSCFDSSVVVYIVWRSHDFCRRILFDLPRRCALVGSLREDALATFPMNLAYQVWTNYAITLLLEIAPTTKKSRSRVARKQPLMDSIALQVGCRSRCVHCTVGVDELAIFTLCSHIVLLYFVSKQDIVEARRTKWSG